MNRLPSNGMALTQNHWESLGKSPVSKHTLVDNPALKFPSYDFEGRSEKQRGSSGTSPRRDVVTVVLLATVVLTVAASTAGLWIKQLKMEERMQELASRSGCVVPHPGQVRAPTQRCNKYNTHYNVHPLHAYICIMQT